MPSLVQAKWYWVPSQVTNGGAGYGILSADPNGMIGTLLGSLGMYWSHSGMFTDAGYHIIHNTGDPGTVGTNDSCSVWVCVPNSLKGDQLRDLKPGVIYQTTADAFAAKEFHFYDQENNGTQVNRNGVVLSPASNAKTFNNQPLTYWLSQAANVFYTSYYGSGASNKQGYYRFYSYTDVNSTEPTGRTANKGNMCSGSIAWALYKAGLPTGSASFDAATRQAAAPILYNSIYNKVDNEAGWLGNALFDVGISADLRDRAANQVVNCMAFNDCGNTSSRWRNGVNTGNSISPDVLLPVGYFNPKNYQWGRQATPDGGYNGKGFYGKVSGITYSGGYWKAY